MTSLDPPALIDACTAAENVGTAVVTKRAASQQQGLPAVLAKMFSFLGEPGGIRTHGPKIKSLVLYQLSYGLAGAL